MSPGTSPRMIANVPAGVAGLLGGLLPGSPTTTTTNSNTNQSSTQNGNFNQFLNSLMEAITNSQQQTNTNAASQGTTSSAANLGPQQQQLLQQLTQKYQQLSNPSLQGYAASQTQGINNNANLQSQAVQNAMAARGLSTSPAAGTAQAGVESQRIGAITGMQQQLPLLQNQLNVSNLGAASGFLSSIPGLLGTTQTQTGSNVGQTSQAGQTSQQTTQGQSSGGTTYQTGDTSATQNSTQTQKQGGSAASGLAGLLGGLFSDERLKDEVVEIPAEKAAARILSLQPVAWKWKGSEVADSGLIAQDLQKKMPDLVRPAEKGLLKVNYAGLISEIIGTLQYLDKKTAKGVA